jgi:RecJ-like exonuclease
MKINTKFDINQSVWKIGRDQEQKRTKCQACGGKGRYVLLDNKSRSCPECYGNGFKSEFLPMKWRVTVLLHIGRVNAKITNIVPDDIFDNVGHYEDGKTLEEYEYMCYETGIGSGSIHNEETLFDIKEEAETECDKRNMEATETVK